MPCYTWQRKCLTFPNPCSVAQQPAACPETQCWFWILAAAIGIALVVDR